MNLSIPIAANAWLRVLTLQDHNTRVVVLGTLLLGVAAGLVGSFTLLRKRALLGDALAHATLPGIGIAFILTASTASAGKSLAALLTGATVTGAAGLGVVLVLRRFTRLKEDAALGAVLSVFFGAGVCMLTIVQQSTSGSAAGLEAFIYGKTASMVPRDVALIAAAGLAVVVVAVLLFKELRLLCFDASYAAAQGWPVLALDILLMAMVTAVTVVGLQAVGLVLVIALLIIPAAAARFWNDRMLPMTVLAAGIGGLCGALGSAVSALAPRLPSGAMIVLVAAFIFGISMAFGTARGLVPRLLRRRQTAGRIGSQHLLRAVYETIEGRGGEPRERVSLAAVLPRRSWSMRSLRRLARVAERRGRVTLDGAAVALTDRGVVDARRVVRNHRLWETYLIHHADVAPSHVDRGADEIEHVLGPDLVAELERQLKADDERREEPMPLSPHPVEPAEIAP